MIETATNRVSRLVHNPWSMLAAWTMVMGLLAGGVTTFYALDRRVTQNTGMIVTEQKLREARNTEIDRRLAQIRQEADADRREIREAVLEMNRKLDEVTRYLRDNPRR